MVCTFTSFYLLFFFFFLACVWGHTLHKRATWSRRIESDADTHINTHTQHGRGDNAALLNNWYVDVTSANITHTTDSHAGRRLPAGCSRQPWTLDDAVVMLLLIRPSFTTPPPPLSRGGSGGGVVMLVMVVEVVVVVVRKPSDTHNHIMKIRCTQRDFFSCLSSSL